MFCQRAGDFWGFCVGFMFCHSTGYLRNRGVGGRFSSPLRNSERLTAPIQRTTLPQSRIRSTAPSGREPGWLSPFNRVLANVRGCGRFSSPLRNSEGFPFHRSTGPCYRGWAPWNSTWRGSICQWFWVMVSSFWESFSSRPGLRVMHSRVGPAPLRQKAAPVVRTRASMRE